MSNEDWNALAEMEAEVSPKVARQEEMLKLLRRQVELLELLVKNQAVAIARLTAGKDTKSGPDMSQPLAPARQRPSNE